MWLAMCLCWQWELGGWVAAVLCSNVLRPSSDRTCAPTLPEWSLPHNSFADHHGAGCVLLAEAAVNHMAIRIGLQVRTGGGVGGALLELIPSSEKASCLCAGLLGTRVRVIVVLVFNAHNLRGGNQERIPLTCLVPVSFAHSVASGPRCLFFDHPLQPLHLVGSHTHMPPPWRFVKSGRPRVTIPELSNAQCRGGSIHGESLQNRCCSVCVHHLHMHIYHVPSV